jgi:hypothetical protein
MQTPLKASRFLAWLALSSAACLIAIWALVSVVIDPYGEFNLLPLRHFFSSHETTPFRLAAALRESPQALVFGNSRSATLASEYFGEPTLNLSMSVYSRPSSIECFLGGLDGQQWAHIRKIYLLAEYHTFARAPSEPCPGSWFSWKAFLWQSFKNTDQLKILRAGHELAKNFSGGGEAEEAPSGARRYLPGMRWAWDGKPDPPPLYVFQDEEDQALGRVAGLAHLHGVELVAFQTVYSDVYWRADDLGLLREYLHRVTRKVPLVALGFHPVLSRRHSSFSDSTHHNVDISAWEASILRDAKARAKWTLREGGVDAYVDRLKKSLK